MSKLLQINKKTLVVSLFVVTTILIFSISNEFQSVERNFTYSAQLNIASYSNIHQKFNNHFPRGMYHITWSNEGVKGQEVLDDLNNIADADFNFVSPALYYNDILPFLDLAKQKNIKVLLGFDGVDEEENYIIEQFKDHPAILGWVAGDDVNAAQPNGSFQYPLDVSKAKFNKFKNIDPDGLVYSSGVGAPSWASLSQWIESNDVIGVQSYPIANEPDNVALEKNFQYYNHAWKELSLNGQEYWANLQSFPWYWKGGRMPSKSEYRNMMYASLINGANGILNYTYYDEAGELANKHPGFWQELAILNKEVERIEEFLIKGSLKRLPHLQPNVHGAYWQHRSQLLFIILNTHRTQTKSISVDLPKGYKVSQPVFNNRPFGLKFSHNQALGKIAPEEVHIYLLKLQS